MCRIVRPVASLDELAEVFDVIGAQLPRRLTHEDRRFADLVARFPEDRSLMLVIEDSGRLVGGALAFRRDPRGATLRVIGLDPGVRGTGLGRRLVERIESEAAHHAATRRCHRRNATPAQTASTTPNGQAPASQP